MKNLGYYNGKTGLINELSVPITDRAFYFGDGVYDAVMCRNNIPYLLWEHVERIFKNCFLLGIIPPLTKEELMNLIKSQCPLVDGEEKFVYFHISRGSGIRNHEFTSTKGNLCIMIKPQKIDNIYEKLEKGETVAKIAKKHGVSQRSILKLNGLKASSIIRIGQRLRVQ